MSNDSTAKNEAVINDPRHISLLLSAATGDSRAYDELVKDYRPLLDAAVAGYAGMLPEHELDELRSEALLAFCRAVRRYDPLYGNVSFGLYARTCVKNGVATAVRNIMKDREKTGFPLEEAEESAEPGPEEELIEREKAEELRKMIRGLLSDYENTVWWSYYAGISVKSIAAQTGKSVDSVENALGRIRRKLKAALK